METNKEAEVILRCRACKKESRKPTKSLLKYYKKTIKVPCEYCECEIQVLVNDDLLKGDNMLTEERTSLLLDTKKVWHTPHIANLIIESVDHPIGVQSLKEGKNILGRQPETGSDTNGIKIEYPDKFLSREHSVITVLSTEQGFCYLLRDNGSSNGTFLDNERLSDFDEVYLRADDNIRIGATILRLT